MAAVTFKGNTTLAGATVGTIGQLRSISTSNTTGEWDTTAHDSTSGIRTHESVYSDGTVTYTGVYDPDDAQHILLETASQSQTAEVYTITFKSGDTWAATCFMTDFTLDGDHESGWTFSVTLQKSGIVTWGHV